MDAAGVIPQGVMPVEIAHPDHVVGIVTLLRRVMSVSEITPKAALFGTNKGLLDIVFVTWVIYLTDLVSASAFPDLC